MRKFIMILVIGCLSTAANASDFQLIVTVTPHFSQPDPANWQDVWRFKIHGTGNAATQLTTIPKGEVHDPATIIFRTPTELLVSNRHGNTLGLGSISRFRLDSAGGYTYIDNFTVTGLEGAHGMSFNPKNGELFVCSFVGNIYRFVFAGDTPVSNGFISTGPIEGILVNPAGNRIFATNWGTSLRQFQINPDNSINEIGSVPVPDAGVLHYIRMGPNDDMYVADHDADRVHHFVFNQNGEAVYDGFVNVPHALDIAFSPDGQEMFVSSYDSEGDPTMGVYRFIYQSSTDSWNITDFIDVPRPAGLATTAIYEGGTLAKFTFETLPPGDTDPNGSGDIIYHDILRPGFDNTLASDLYPPIGTWNFSTMDHTGPAASFNADEGTGTFAAYHDSSITDWYSNEAYDSNRGFGANAWGFNDTDPIGTGGNHAGRNYFQFKTTTTGYTSIALSFEINRSNVAISDDWSVCYSVTQDEQTEGGTGLGDHNDDTFFTKHSDFTLDDPNAFASYLVDLSDATVLNNQENIWIRLVMDGATTDPNSRVDIDNVCIQGISVIPTECGDRGTIRSPADISGPEGTPDCYVNFYDFATMASAWLDCTDPAEPGCD